MPYPTMMSVIADQAGRLTDALEVHGRKAVTTDANGDVHIPWLIDTLEAMGMSLKTRGPDGTGLFTATISRTVHMQDQRLTAISVRNFSQSSAIVEAAIVMLLESTRDSAWAFKTTCLGSFAARRTR